MKIEAGLFTLATLAMLFPGSNAEAYDKLTSRFATPLVNKGYSVWDCDAIGGEPSRIFSHSDAWGTGVDCYKESLLNLKIAFNPYCPEAVDTHQVSLRNFDNETYCTSSPTAQGSLATCDFEDMNAISDDPNITECTSMNVTARSRIMN